MGPRTASGVQSHFASKRYCPAGSSTCVRSSTSESTSGPILTLRGIAISFVGETKCQSRARVRSLNSATLSHDTSIVESHLLGICTGLGNETDGGGASGIGSIHRYAIRTWLVDCAGCLLVQRFMPFKGTGSANADRNSARGKNVACNSAKRPAPPAASSTCGPKKNVATEAAKPADCCVIVGLAGGSVPENAGSMAWRSCAACWSGGMLALSVGNATPYCEEKWFSMDCRFVLPGADCSYFESV